MRDQKARLLLASTLVMMLYGCADRPTQPATGPFDIAFIRRANDVESSPELFVMRADGTNQKQLTWNRGASSPAWSPDGSEIAFNSNGTEIDVINVETGATRKILGGNAQVRWSPDGTRIAYDGVPRLYYPVNEIYTISPDGTNSQQLTFDGLLSKFVGDWSPDGTRLVLAANNDNPGEPYTGLYIMGADGTGMTRITDTVFHGNGAVVSWSPDGNTIAFVADGGYVGASMVPYHWTIHTMRLDGSMLTQLSRDGDHDTNPSWSSDGEKIIFQSERDGHSQIYVMNADGTAQRRLVTSRTNDTQPVWRRH